MIKGVTRVVFMLTVIFALVASSAFAANEKVTSDTVSTEKEKQHFTFSINEKAKGKVTKKQLDDIASQAAELHPNLPEYNITIEEQTGEDGNTTPALNTFSATEAVLNPFHWYDTGSTYFTSKTVSTRDNATAAKFVTSKAKGETTTLGYNFELTVSSSYSASGSMPGGAGASVEGSLAVSATKTISSSTTYSSPDESSTAISRSFYVTGYKTYGTYSTIQYGYISGHEHARYSGNYQDAQQNFTSWSLLVY